MYSTPLPFLLFEISIDRSHDQSRSCLASTHTFTNMCEHVLEVVLLVATIKIVYIYTLYSTSQYSLILRQILTMLWVDFAARMLIMHAWYKYGCSSAS